MGMAKEVTLPDGYPPRFPDKCIVCHEVPNSTIKIAQNSQNPLLVFFVPILWLFGWSRVEIPICESCKFRFRFQRWGRTLVCWALIIVAVWLIMPFFRGWNPVLQKVVVGVLVLLAIAPYILGEVFSPRVFDTTARHESIDYEFASSEYAAEFYLLNRPFVIKSDFRDANAGSD